MLLAMQRAIHSATSTDLPFSCILILPSWDKSPHLHTSIRHHSTVRLLAHVNSGHFRFIPPGVDPMVPAAYSTQSPAKWGIDIFLVANPSGYDAFVAPNLKQLQMDLAATLRSIINFKDLHVKLFPEFIPPPSIPTDVSCHQAPSAFSTKRATHCYWQ